MIVCVPKKPRPVWPEDLRSLTLLNADLKLLSRILANRIHPWLATLLPPSQHCEIHGHNIFEAIAGIREAIAYRESHGRRCVYCHLTLKKHFTIYLITIYSGFWTTKGSACFSKDIYGVCTRRQHRPFVLMVILLRNVIPVVRVEIIYVEGSQ